MDIHQVVRHLREHVSRLIQSPTDELDRGGRFLAYQIRLWWFCGRKLVKDRLPLVANALSYKTLLSVIPLFIIFFLIVSAIIPGDVQDSVKDFVFQFLNLREIGYETPADSGDGAEATSGDPGPTTMGDAGEALNLRAVIEQQVSGVVNATKAQGPSVTIITVVLLIFVGMSIFSTVEGAFNNIWEVRHRRSWFVRLRDFLATMTLLVLLLGVVIYVGRRIEGAVSGVAVAGWVFHTLRRTVPLLAAFVAFFIVYKTLPNVRVQNRAALMGALVTSVLWEFGAKLGLQLYIQLAAGLKEIYGYLALIPIFMLWVWVTWIIVLFGAELAYVIQHMKALTRDQLDRDRRWRFVRADLAALATGVLVGRRFAQGGLRPTRSEISRAVGISEGDAAEVIDTLLEHGVIVAAGDDDGDDAYVPARPLEAISVGDLLGAGEAIELGTSDKEQTDDLLHWAAGYMEQQYGDQSRRLRNVSLEALTRSVEANGVPEPA